MNFSFLFDAIGWTGTFLYLFAFVVYAPQLPAGRRLYAVVNALAAAAVTAVSIAKGSPQAVALNGIWLVISLAAYRGDRLIAPEWGRPVFRVFAVASLLAIAALSAVLSPDRTISALAWLGTTSVIGSYLLFVNGRLGFREFTWWCMTGSAVLLPRLALDANWPAFAVEACWTAVALFTLLRLLRTPRPVPAPE